MISGRSLKVGAVSAVAGVSLLAGGLLFSGSLVSAQTPEPTPQGQTAPADPAQPADPNATPHDKADCPNMGGSTAPSQGSGTSSGVSFHRGSARGL
jgi:hypothetical protein